MTAVSVQESVGGEEEGRGEWCQGRNDRRKLMEGPQIRRGGAERKQEWKIERERDRGRDADIKNKTHRKKDRSRERER